MTAPSLTEQLQRLVGQYREAGMPWPATKQEIAAWAIAQGLWKPAPASLVKQLGDQIGQAMREEYHIDPQGRSVRSKHAARLPQEGVQVSFKWDDIRTADHTFMHVAFQHRRHAIVGDCKQLKADVDSYNENRQPSKPVQLILDFTQDVAEQEAAELLSKTAPVSG